MDHQKDSTQKDTEITTQTSVPNAVAQSIRNLSLFQNKSLKMASALYLVTELFSETEPIREALREQAIALVLIAADRRIMESSDSIDSAHYVLDTTVSLITVLNTSRLLSDMNASILTAELQTLRSLLGSIGIPSAKLSELVLHDLFANPVAPVEQSESMQPASAHNSQFSVSPDVPQIKVTPTAESSHRKESVRMPVSKTQIAAVKKTHPGISKYDRRGQILAAIKNEGSSIKDIAIAVKGCSEKTIQRELNALIGQGTIVREGEKRWSVYKRT